MNPEATFDCLFLANRFQRETGSFSPVEVHLFAYLACLLWLYQRHAAADWGYSFVATELGAPYSLDLATAMDQLEVGGFFFKSSDRLAAAPEVQNTLDLLAGLELNQPRLACLHAAFSSVSAFSMGMVGSALGEEPELKRAREVPNTRQLLEETAQLQLHEQFDALRTALREPSADLRVPAVVWLETLYRALQIETA